MRRNDKNDIRRPTMKQVFQFFPKQLISTIDREEKYKNHKMTTDIR